MRQTYLSTILLVLSVSFASPVFGQQSVKSKNYTIQYPLGWTLKPNYMGTETMALSQPESNTDDFMENCNTVSESTGSAVTPSKYQDMSLPMMKKMLTKFKERSAIPTTTATGLDALVMDYTHEMGQLKLYVRATFFTEGTQGYVVTCTAKPETFSRFEMRFDFVTQSFRLEKRKTKTKSKTKKSDAGKTKTKSKTKKK